MISAKGAATRIPLVSRSIRIAGNIVDVFSCRTGPSVSDIHRHGTYFVVVYVRQVQLDYTLITTS